MKFLSKVEAALDPKMGATNRHATVLMVLIDELQKALREKDEDKIKEEVGNLKAPIDDLVKLWHH